MMGSQWERRAGWGDPEKGKEAEEEDEYEEEEEDGRKK